MASSSHSFDGRGPPAENLFEWHPLKVTQHSTSEWEELLLDWLPGACRMVAGGDCGWQATPTPGLQCILVETVSRGGVDVKVLLASLADWGNGS